MGQGASQQIVAARVEGPQFKQLSPQSVVLAHGILRNEVEVLESPQKVVRRALGNIQETAHVVTFSAGLAEVNKQRMESAFRTDPTS